MDWPWWMRLVHYATEWYAAEGEGSGGGGGGGF